MKKFVLTMTDGTQIEIVAQDMKQEYGFLVFNDDSGEPNIGVRAELVREWELQEVAPQPAKVRRIAGKVS